MTPPSTQAALADRTTLLGSMNPWGGSKPARKPSSNTGSVRSVSPAPPAATAAAAIGDHSTSSYYGRSMRLYPAGCPPLKVQWFHAVDVPKRKSQWFDKFQKKESKESKESKPPPPPKKYVAFAADDNRSIESAYQRELEDLEDKGASLADKKGTGVKVPVNEDFLFDVDIGARELSPVYWLGPVYDVRRGSWFYQEGSSLRPCEENLAAQLEEGYLKTKPWLYPRHEQSSSSASKDGVASGGGGSGSSSTAAEDTITVTVTNPSTSTSTSTATDTNGQDDNGKAKGTTAAAPPAPVFHPETHRLFGQYMNHIATYQDETTAWLSTDGMLSWVASTMYERFSGGAFMSGVKLVRGYSEPKKAKDKDGKDGKDSKGSKEDAKKTGNKHQLAVDEVDEKRMRALKRRSAPASTKASSSFDETARPSIDGLASSEIARRGSQLSSLMGKMTAGEGGKRRDVKQEEEEIRQREEKEIQDDYNAQKGETQGREIEHLILVTHGIGQLLGLRMESLNFIHDVNMLRKTLKSVYASSPELRALNAELLDGPGNCRIQVLPVCWRHLLDFPQRSDAGRQEHDLGDVHQDEAEYITIEGVAFARSLISDLALDILLYQSAYREQISAIVLSESNRIYRLFLARNPSFHGTVHVIGHSLGSAILFDILCQQKDRPSSEASRPANPLRIWPSATSVMDSDMISGADAVPRDDEGGYDNDLVEEDMLPGSGRKKTDPNFAFEVQDFYCLGSPIGLFQMLKGHTIGARYAVPNVAAATSQAVGAVLDHSMVDPLDMDNNGADEPGRLSAPSGQQRLSAVTGLPSSVSSPKVGQLYNIFHPSDPISYRLEPLIAPAMASLKPQPLPYTKKGLFGGALAPQGLTGIGAKVGQSVSGLWSSLSAGLATNLLNRSLGLSQEDVAKLEQQASSASGPGGGRPGDGSGGPEQHQPIPVNHEVETLYAHFEKKRADMAKERDDGDRWHEEEAKTARLRREEAKIRALNRNGRVDYSIQESVLDFNPINTIASHMAYWADEDVSHFIMSQVFARKQRQGKDKT